MWVKEAYAIWLMNEYYLRLKKKHHRKDQLYPESDGYHHLANIYTSSLNVLERTQGRQTTQCWDITLEKCKTIE